MNRTRMIAAAGMAALTTGVVASSALAHSSAGTLVASVSDPLNISLTQGGKKVTTLKAGTYTIKVQDKASDHNFHLTGPGLNKTTSVSAKGTSTWKVTFKKGSTYKYVCDPHASFMKGSFKVT
jgi:plastocyanin